MPASRMPSCCIQQAFGTRTAAHAPDREDPPAQCQSVDSRRTAGPSSQDRAACVHTAAPRSLLLRRLHDFQVGAVVSDAATPSLAEARSPLVTSAVRIPRFCWTRGLMKEFPRCWHRRKRHQLHIHEWRFAGACRILAPAPSGVMPIQHFPADGWIDGVRR